MPPKNSTFVSDDLLRTLARLVDEWRRLEAGRSTEQRRGARPDPPPYRELTDADRKAAEDDDDWLSDYVLRESADRFRKQAALGRGRCEAGVKRWDLLRCQRSSDPGERWCSQHHPAPPEPLPSERRLHSWDLRVRPDGDLIAAVYGLADRVEAMERLLSANLERLSRADERNSEDVPQVLDAAQAANYLGISRAYLYKLCKQHRVPFARVGGLYKFQTSELDGWLTRKTLPAVR